MKSLVFAIVLSMFGTSHTPIWNCVQVGYLNSAAVMVVSDIREESWSSSKTREQEFSKVVQKVWKLENAYEPICRDFVTRKEAEESYVSLFKKAQSAKIVVLPMGFPFKEKIDVQVEAVE